MTPTFVMRTPGFLGMTNPDDEEYLWRYRGERKLFGCIRRLYVHGALESKVGYDIAAFTKGDIVDAMFQEAVLIDTTGEQYPAAIVTIKKDNGERWAFIVENTSREIGRAVIALTNSEEFI
jgi:hypothetical protein